MVKRPDMGVRTPIVRTSRDRITRVAEKKTPSRIPYITFQGRA